MKRSSLLALAAMAMMGSSMAQAAQPAPRKGSSRGHRSPPLPPRKDDSMKREIAEWNRRVEEQKQEKKLAKLQRRRGA